LKFRLESISAFVDFTVTVINFISTMRRTPFLPRPPAFPLSRRKSKLEVVLVEGDATIDDGHHLGVEAIASAAEEENTVNNNSDHEKAVSSKKELTLENEDSFFDRFDVAITAVTTTMTHLAKRSEQIPALETDSDLLQTPPTKTCKANDVQEQLGASTPPTQANTPESMLGQGETCDRDVDDNDDDSEAAPSESLQQRWAHIVQLGYNTMTWNTSDTQAKVNHTIDLPSEKQSTSTPVNNEASLQDDASVGSEEQPFDVTMDRAQAVEKKATNDHEDDESVASTAAIFEPTAIFEPAYPQEPSIGAKKNPMEVSSNDTTRMRVDKTTKENPTKASTDDIELWNDLDDVDGQLEFPDDEKEDTHSDPTTPNARSDDANADQPTSANYLMTQNGVTGKEMLFSSDPKTTKVHSTVRFKDDSAVANEYAILEGENKPGKKDEHLADTVSCTGDTIAFVFVHRQSIQTPRTSSNTYFMGTENQEAPVS
jgi:hypothetical protein